MHDKNESVSECAIRECVPVSAFKRETVTECGVRDRAWLSAL